MINNLGIDIIKNERIENSISKEFIEQVLTEKEREIYYNKTGKKN